MWSKESQFQFFIKILLKFVLAVYDKVTMTEYIGSHDVFTIWRHTVK